MALEETAESVARATLLTTGLTSVNAISNLTMVTSQALCLAALNSVSSQQQGNITRQASSVQGTSGLYSTGAAVTGAVVEGLIQD